MLTKNDLQQIKGIVKEEVKPIKKQLDTVEMKVEVVNKRVDQLGGQLNQTGQKLEKAITKSQEETIEVLSDLIHTGYSLHEKRIRKVEGILQITNPQ
ncbi:MAG: hypothetical protein Q7R31_00980 [Candidatus Levybacteria bacterium]|nr:hypothetical protein [Candidatus Levybacteria bacterium]